MTVMLHPTDNSNTQLLVSEFFRVRRHLDAALEYANGTHDAFDIFRGLKLGDFQLWPGQKSAVVTELVDYPKTKSCRFFLAGGNLKELRKMEDPIIDWSKRYGCRRVEIAGRPGWERALEGYSKTAVWLTKEIFDE